MISGDTFPHDRCIDIFPRTGRLVRLILTGVVFALMGLFLIYYSRREIEVVVGSAAAAMGVLTVIACVAHIVLARRGYPSVRICDDRIESFVPVRMRYQVLPFADVQAFFVLDLYSTKVIRARLNNGKRKDTSLQSSLVPNIDDICQLLNDRLADYRRRHQRG